MTRSGLMQAAARRLTDAEIDALSAYYAAQPAAAPVPAENAPTAAAGEVEVGPDEVHAGEVVQQGPPPAGREPGEEGHFRAPSRGDLPDGPFGEAIRQGQAIFENTNAHPVSAKYVGNDQACGNCHLDAGRLAESAPLWAAWVAYPAYRSKNRKVNTYIERVQGCFTYSMNAQASAAGGPPSADSETMVSLVAYSYWLAKGAPTGDDNHARPRLSAVEGDRAGFRSGARRGRLRGQVCPLPRRERRRSDAGRRPYALPAALGAGVVQLGGGHAQDRHRRRLHQAQHAARVSPTP